MLKQLNDYFLRLDSLILLILETEQDFLHYFSLLHVVCCENFRI